MTAHAKIAENRILVFAKAPIAGLAKTRLIPMLGAHGAAALQRVLIEHTLTTALAAKIGAVELWCAPNALHPVFASCAMHFHITAQTQCEGDLGARMLHAAQCSLESASRVIIIGTDSPALTAVDLRRARAALDESGDAVFAPAEDGGYILLGLKQCEASLFANIPWGTEHVMAVTRKRLTALGWRWHELPASWDVDRPADYQRLIESRMIPNLEEALSAQLANQAP